MEQEAGTVLNPDYAPADPAEMWERRCRRAREERDQERARADDIEGRLLDRIDALKERLARQQAISAAWERRYQRDLCVLCGKHLCDRTQTHRKGCPYREETDGTNVIPS